ncbi:hypothetical protein E2R51_12530 [Jeotgalibacillus sp. S-D1]|uniref:two-component system regulatory protein YycI n=1 Tax=Jeotgalibacillus sp. S-D1 TaxID=2552189 RepID=UPI001059C46A|nr:two-component system regulatory protein YycI [Jeotgalibacillus sp. S-D1]TDL32032.1 hypothetical protein E2R51_12530 [Jeotgalibacillus sp. S-D1]
MDWSKTKTIFIIVFLILDIFLFTLFMNKYQSSQLEVKSELTFDQRFLKDNITFETPPPDDVDAHPYLNASVYRFSASEVSDLKGQTASVRNNLVLESKLDTPLDIDDPSDPEELEDYLEEFVTGGEDYTFWDYQEGENRLIYHQEFKDMPLYHNINGRLVVHLNDSNQAIGYEQTMLTSIEEFAEEQTIITPETALEGFYRRNIIEPNSEVIEVELGYYPFIQLSEATANTQVLTPTWRMLVEQEDGDRDNHYMNAVNPSIIEINQESLEFQRLEEIQETVE